MSLFRQKKVLLFIVSSLWGFFTQAEAFGNKTGLSVEAGISVPYFYQPLSVSPEIFSGKIDCPAFVMNTQARYQIPGTNVTVSGIFGYGYLGVTSKNMWNDETLNGMKGSNWSILTGAGYSFKTKNEKFQFIPSAVIGMRNEKLSGSLYLTSLDKILIKNDYEYSSTSFELGTDFYLVHKFNNMFGISLSVTPLVTFYSTGSLDIKDYLNFSKWTLDCSPESGSFILDSKLNFVFCL